MGSVLFRAKIRSKKLLSVEIHSVIVINVGMEAGRERMEATVRISFKQPGEI